VNGSDFAQLAVAGGSAGGMFGLVMVAVRWAANFVAGRLDKKEAQLDASTQLLIQHLRDQVAILVGDCRELREWRASAEKDLFECKQRHAESEAEVMRLKATMQGYGDARDKAQLIVSAEKRKDAAK
jgi:chromosome segregation ATPase